MRAPLLDLELSCLGLRRGPRHGEAGCCTGEMAGGGVTARAREGPCPLSVGGNSLAGLFKYGTITECRAYYALQRAC